MKRLWYPFLAGSGALIAAGLVLGPVIFWRFRDNEQIAYGLLLGVLASVVLYAVMRAISSREG